jgi:uncharacterized repeat protein (TIGR03803 family)
LVASSGGTYTTRQLYGFSGENGNEPLSGLVYSGGYLYGTTFLGGSNGYGTLFVVNPAANTTTTTLTSSLNPSTIGAAVTFTATVTSSAGSPPDGDIVVFQPLGQATLSGGTAQFTTSTLPIGKTKVTAVYEGDLNFIGSKSATLAQHVDK